MKRIMMGFIVGMLLICASTDAIWQDYHEFQEDVTIRDMWVSSENSVYLGTETGILLHRVDGEWLEISTPLDYVECIHGVDDDFFVIADYGGNFAWWDAGTWKQLSMRAGTYVSMCGRTRDEFFISTDYMIKKFKGTHWETVLEYPDDTDSIKISQIELTEEQNLIVEITYRQCYWESWGSFYVRICIDTGVTCFEYENLESLVPIYHDDTYQTVKLISANSQDDIFVLSYGGQTYDYDEIVHFNGEFYTRVLDTTGSIYYMLPINGFNGFMTIKNDRFGVWDGHIPLEYPAAPFENMHSNRVDGINETDFWVCNSYRNICHWVGPVPDVPADTGAFMKLHDYRIHTGESFHLELAACNATDAPLTGNVYCCMMLFGTSGLWFWPNWTKEPTLIDPVTVTLEPNSMRCFDVLNFTWPELDYQVDGLFHSIMVTESGDITDFQSTGFAIR